MRPTFDFKIIGQTGIPKISLIEAQNEQAFEFITGEQNLAILPDGSAPICDASIDDFINVAEHAQLSCALS